MPQLNPSPWFMIFMLVWTFLFIFLNKALSSTQPNLPITKESKKEQSVYWNWPWS